MINERWVAAVRFAVGAAVLVGAVGLAGHLAGSTPLGGTWLTAALGPTAYVLLRPDDPGRIRDGVAGHAVGIVAGLAASAAFGLWDAPSVVALHAESLPRVGAQAIAIGLTLLVLAGTGVQHPPSAATTLLVASGIGGPGPGLAGLVSGLVVVLGVLSVPAWWRARSARTRAGTDPE